MRAKRFLALRAHGLSPHTQWCDHDHRHSKGARPFFASARRRRVHPKNAPGIGALASNGNTRASSRSPSGPSPFPASTTPPPSARPSVPSPRRTRSARERCSRSRPASLSRSAGAPLSVPCAGRQQGAESGSGPIVRGPSWWSSRREARTRSSTAPWGARRISAGQGAARTRPRRVRARAWALGPCPAPSRHVPLPPPHQKLGPGAGATSVAPPPTTTRARRASFSRPLISSPTACRLRQRSSARE
jgi:hypothetical protein